MKLYAALFVAGMLSFFMGERVWHGSPFLRLFNDLFGAVLLLGGILLIIKDFIKAQAHQKSAYMQPLIYAGVAILSLLIYTLGSDSVIEFFGLEGESAHKFAVVIACLWPIVWLCGMLPLLALSRMVYLSSKHFSIERASKMSSLWLTAAFALSALFPLNYFTHDTNERWDLGYFKTAMPGTATTQLIDSLNEPVTAYLFFPSNSDVRQEIRTYFDQIDSNMLDTTYIDLLEESISEDIKSHIKKGRVKDNGSILLVKGKINKSIAKIALGQEEIKSGDHFMVNGIVAGKCDGSLLVHLIENETAIEKPISSISLEGPGKFEMAVPNEKDSHIIAICDRSAQGKDAEENQAKGDGKIQDGIDLISDTEHIEKSATEKLTLPIGPIATKTKLIKIGKDFKDAKKKLKKLDADILKAMTKLTQEKKTVYITSGHEEMHWKSRDGLLKSQQIAQFKRMLRALNYEVKELNIGNGLASEIPIEGSDKADAVLVLGPKEPFLTEEIETINRYREKGGSLLIALEPGGDPLDGLLTPLNLQFEPKTFLVNEDPKFAITRSRRDIATNKYSTHPSITQLSRYGKASMAFFGMGAIEKLKDSKVKSVIRSPEKAWKDINGNLKHDDNSEKKKIHDIAVASSEKHTVISEDGEETEVESRVIVIGDSTWLSDPWLPQIKTNQVASWDFLKWLIKDPTAGGVSNEEKDVKIIHSKAGQAWIFYGTVLGIPLLLLIIGWTYIGLRRKWGNAQ